MEAQQFLNQFQDPVNVYSKMQKMCTKKCLLDISEPYLNPAQEDCLYRCAFKFKEALFFGQEVLTYQKKLIIKETEKQNNFITQQQQNQISSDYQSQTQPSK